MSLRYSAFLFDLDGTLTNPKMGITRSIAHAVSRLGLGEPDPDQFTSWIGPPLKESFMQHFELNNEDATRAVQYYREYFEERGIFENQVIDGMPGVLANLQRTGARLFVATSKPWIYANAILDHFSLGTWFEGVAGSELDGRRTDKGEVISYALSTFAIDAHSALMVGDRHHDLIGARACHVDAVGVTFGFGSPEELARENPAFIAGSPDALWQWIEARLD